MQDIRIALRQLRKSPGFALTVILTIALGIGANTAIFTLVHAVLMKSLPVTDPKSLYRLGDKDDCCVNGGFINDDGDFDLETRPTRRTIVPTVAEDPSEEEADRSDERAEVHDGQKPRLTAPGEENHAEEAADQAAVEGHAAFPDFEDVERMGEIIFRIVEHDVAEPSADDDPEGAVDKQVVDALWTGPLRAVPVAVVGHHAANDPPAENKTGDIGECIPADREGPDGHQHGIEGGERDEGGRHERFPAARMT